MDEWVDARDRALQMSCPITAAPKFGTRNALQVNGQRMIVASNGVFLEVRRAWLHCIRQVGTWTQGMTTPFGQMEPSTTLAFGKIPVTLLAEFVRLGREALPLEAAGAIVFDEETGNAELVMHEARLATAESVNYVVAPLARHQHIVVDLHTHGTLPAFFSVQDDADDRGGVKIAGVFGNLDEENPSCAFRLCLNGVFENLLVPEQVGRQVLSERTQSVERNGYWPMLEALGFIGG